MKYKDFTINYEKPFGRLEQFYEELGVFDLIKERKKEYNIPEDAYVSYTLIRCNPKTYIKLEEQLKYNWMYYSYDRYTGRPKRKTLVKYKRPHPLYPADQSRIAWHYGLGIAPVKDENVPEDVIRIITEWDQETVNDIISRYEAEKGDNF